MINKLTLLIVVFIVFAVNIPIPKIGALAPSLVISEIQTGGANSSSAESTKEFVEIYNQSNQDVSLDGLVIKYFSKGGTPSTIITIPPNIHVSARSFILLSKTNYLEADFYFTKGFDEKDGSVVLEFQDVVVDTVGWGDPTKKEGTSTSAHGFGQSIQRKVDINTLLFQDTSNNSDDFIISDSPHAQGGGVYEYEAPPDDVCPNIPDIQTLVPEGYIINETGQCVSDEIVPELEPEVDCDGLQLNEILPNPTGDDAGKEYVELYNPSDEVVSLVGCSIEIGTSTKQLHGEIQPGYKAIYGNTIPNATAVAISLITKTTEEVVNYPDNMNEDESWALINGTWQITNQPTPDVPNLASQNTESGGKGSGSEDDSLKPCAPDQYRNPATNRCKKFATSASLKPCALDQIRNPETNRCRKIALTASNLAACKPDQYRNPETNRCKKISASSTSLVPCKTGYQRNKETNRCRKVAGVTTSNPLTQVASTVAKPINYPILVVVSVLALGYGAYEYRQDIANKISKLRAK